MTEEKEKIKWKKCPKCDGSMPDWWKEHRKCGWGVKDFQPGDSPQAKNDVKEAEIRRSVVLKSMKQLITDIYNPKTKEDLVILLKKCEYYLSTGEWVE